MMVYTSMWFQIKRNHTISQAPLHVFDTLSKCQKHAMECNAYVSILAACIYRMYQYAYVSICVCINHVSILAAMVSSTNLNHNELAWRRILCSKELRVPDWRIRQLRVTKLNINANSYIDLIDWTMQLFQSHLLLILWRQTK